MSTSTSSSAGFRDVFAVNEFSVLYVAGVVSVAGDQVARVALAVLVFARTGSPGLTGLAVALTFLPHLIGGPMLSGLADRLPRRTVIIWCEAIRVVLIGSLVIPALPLPVIFAAVALAELASPPAGAARSALMPEIFTAERTYVASAAITNASFEVAQIVGFATGGAVIALLGVHLGFAVDAATFALSGVLVYIGVQRRPATVDAEHAGWWPQLVGGARVVFGDAWLRRLVLLAWLAGILIAPEALAAPIAAGFGAGPVAVSLLLAAGPLGVAVGALIVVRLVPEPLQPRAIGPLALGAGLPLLGCLLHPSLPVVWSLWTVSGLLTAYSLLAYTSFAVGVPSSRRGQAFGLAQSGLVAVQGIGLSISGLVADHLSPLTVVGLAGLASVGLAAAILFVPASRPPTLGDNGA